MSAETAATLRAVGHADRVWILLELLRQGPATTSDLASRSRLSQPDLSAHLSRLTERGLIRRPGNQRTPHELVDDRATVELLRAAAGITAGRYNDAEADQLAQELARRRLKLAS